tara:strand:+ start:12316 stop:15165 length:2850 start_codon:yes stop_codon:yes gene_type:complete
MKKYIRYSAKWFSALFFILFVLTLQEAKAQEIEEVLGTNADTATAKGVSKVIDVAYGQQIYSSVTSSISTIYSDEITKSTVASTGEALFGRLPGLTVIKNSGQPGSVPSIYIRGRNTYGNSEPLVIVDGFRSNYDQLSLYEIESISVLKDAAATAMYGQEAANGVLLVTTKRGTISETKIDFAFDAGWQSPTQLPDLLNASEYATLYNEALANDGLAPRYSVEDIASYGKDGAFKYTHPDNRFFDDLLKKSSPIMLGGLNITGGTDKVRYMVALGFMHNGGIYNYTDLNDSYSTQTTTNRYNLRSNLDINITEKLSAKIDISGRLDQRNYPGVTADIIFSSMYNTPPQEYAMINPDGTPGGSAQFTDNPYGLISQLGFKSFTDRDLNTSLMLAYDFDGALEGLKVSGGGAVSNWMRAWDNKEKTQFAVYSIDSYVDDTTVVYSKYNDDQDLSWVTNAESNQRINVEANASYERTFGLHSLHTMLMYHMDEYEANTNHYKFKNAGFGLRVHYGYDQKYFGEFTSGYYGQEQYMTGNRFGFFPAAGVAWVPSNEDFLKDNSVIDYLKIRASYGMVGGGMAFTGTDLSSRIFFNQYYSGAPGSAFGENSQTNYAGRQEGRSASPNVTWDKSYKTDISFETTLWGHVNYMFNYYNDKRTDILTIDNQIPAAFGMNNGRQAYLNSGEVVNKGYETTLDLFGDLGGFEYSIQGGLWFNRSEIVSQPNATVYEYDHRSAIGKPVGQLFGYETAGFFSSDAEAANHAYLQTFGDVGAGDVIYVNQTGDDHVIDNNDQIALGYTAIPEYTYSLGGDLKYKRVSLSVFGQGTMNSSIMLGGYFIPFNTQGNSFDYALDRWNQDNMINARFPRLSTVSNSNNTQPSDIWLISGDYFKIRNIELGYMITEKGTSKMFSNTRIYVRGMNLFTFAKEIDFTDPETRLGYPSMKSVSFGISTSF